MYSGVWPERARKSAASFSAFAKSFSARADRTSDTICAWAMPHRRTSSKIRIGMRSGYQQAAVNDYHLSGHERGTLAGEGKSYLGDVFGLAEAMQRLAGDETLQPFFVLPEVLA